MAAHLPQHGRLLAALDPLGDRVDAERARQLDDRRHDRAILAAQHELHPDLVVLTGLRQGAEEVGARAASAADVPYVAVLPYPDPVAGRPEVAQAAFQRLLDGAVRVVTLEQHRPGDGDGKRASLQRRDGWLRKVADAAIVVTDGEDPDAELAVKRYGDAVGDELWEYRTVEL